MVCPVGSNRQVTRSVRCRRWDAARVLTAWCVLYILVYPFQRGATAGNIMVLFAPRSLETRLRPGEKIFFGHGRPMSSARTFFTLSIFPTPSLKPSAAEPLVITTLWLREVAKFVDLSKPARGARSS